MDLSRLSLPALLATSILAERSSCSSGLRAQWAAWAARGAVLAAEMPLIMTASAGVIMGTFIGVPILGRIPPRAYRPLVGTLLVLLGLSLLL